jgi:UDP-N-acetyl-D-mannosaminuronic acid transferase (WecB/TagA/CpsF family)
MADQIITATDTLKVSLFASHAALCRSLQSRQFRVYSCLNGFTLRALVNEQAYDKLLAAGQTGFVVDGLSAFRHLSAHGLATERICGRDLMAAALQLPHGPLVAVGGSQPDDPAVNDTLARHFGQAIQVLTPPMFKTDAELAAYADRAAAKIPDDALVLVFIRSPLQDLLAGELAARTRGTVFINVGAVLDDILRARLGAIRVFSALRLEWLYRLLANPRRTLPKIIAMVHTRVDMANVRYKWHRL